MAFSCDSSAKPLGDYEYSIWMMPGAKATRQIGALIAELSSNHGSVMFEPHVTLLGYTQGTEPEVLKKTELLSKSISPMRCEFDGIAHSGDYLRAIYVNIKVSEALRHARSKASEIFGIEGSDFKPHLSLIYSEMGETERAKAIAGIDSSLFEGLKGFDVDCLYLYRRRWTGKEWMRVASFRISDQAHPKQN